MSIDTNMRSLAQRAQRAYQLEQQLANRSAVPGGAGAVAPDTERVLNAYETENQQLKAALAAARQSPVAPSVGPNSLYGRGAPEPTRWLALRAADQGCPDRRQARLLLLRRGFRWRAETR